MGGSAHSSASLLKAGLPTISIAPGVAKGCDLLTTTSEVGVLILTADWAETPRARTVAAMMADFIVKEC